ncbi:Wzy polymerase domain-containing protein [Paucibacter sp. R3-3]|uniref:Wzy polymerase domain-containing protein n=1 Tax=Roseateles agri TaxID=3098619 RepID=A0ABU5DFF1_9BURK|nr:Wzy polymerase domain-containing protein [Paucibacter sp. R3-3]MDY0744498.1 Wzy polymerase domain-containing protein [Paucibacter sp. R3-3]
MSPAALNRPPFSLAWLSIACFTTLAPLVAFNLTPSSTLFNQLAAVLGAGGVLLSLFSSQSRFGSPPATWALLIVAASPLLSSALNGLPASLALSATGVLLIALLLMLGAQALDQPSRRQWFGAFCWALLAAGLLSLLVSIIQVFFPDLADGKIIARSGIPGRALGNMRQPNHLASLLMWSSVAAVYLTDQDERFEAKGARIALPLLLFGLVFAVVLSASRTGMVGVFLLAIWGLLDRKLKRESRWALIATPLMMAVSWYAMYLWANSGGGHAFGAESRITSEGAGSPERMKILANAWELVKRNPWTGVGWGEFNLAWTMTPFPNRPIAFFDHSHNIVMQLAVELGIPACLLIVGLLCWSLWRALRDSMLARDNSDAVVRRCAFMIVLMIGLHSLLEYPLWYAYFLLPAAFAFGLALGPLEPSAKRGPSLQIPLLLAGVAVIVGSLYAVWDYRRVVVIYVPPQHAEPLADRIEEGQRSTFFAHHADYAAATSLEPGEYALQAARKTGHNLIDARLMMSWAQSLHATGDDDRARYIVQRLKEFRSPTGDEWLAICKVVTKPEEQPFQCAPPKREYDWREMR